MISAAAVRLSGVEMKREALPLGFARVEPRAVLERDRAIEPKRGTIVHV